MVTQYFNRIGRFTLILLAVTALAYCNDSGSPTAPSFPSSGGSRSGATVQGTINAGRQSAALRTAATNSPCGTHITVTLTPELGDPTLELETDVDCAGGTFMFTNVPPGRFTLNFFLLGEGGSPVLDQTTGLIEGVCEGCTLEVEVTIVDNVVDVVEIEREDSPSEDSVSDDSVSEDSVSEDSVSEDSVSEDSVSEDSVSEDSVSEDSVSEDSVSEDSESEDSVSEDSESEDSESEDSSGDD